MIVEEEGRFHGIPNFDIFYRVWKPSRIPHGTVLITHGVGEHSGAYDRLARELAADGFTVLSWDVRGHGQTSGVRGWVGQFAFFSEDLNRLIPFLAEKYHQAGRPFFLFGHSMGGLITLKTYLNFHPNLVSGLILSSPTIAIKVPTPAWAVNLVGRLNQIFPSTTFNSVIGLRHLTRDLAFRKKLSVDELRHNRASFSLLHGTLLAAEEVRNSASSFSIPMLMLVARHDSLVSPDAAEDFFNHAPSKKKHLVIFEQSRHEIFNDSEREKALSELRAYLKTFPPQP